LTPELIQAQSFTTGFRGYDSSEVRSFLSRVANELRAWRERAAELESAWHSAEERAARPPVLDEDTLMAAVGEETAAILRTARAAATELRTKAAEETERSVGGARAEAERMVEEAREEAERLLAESRLEAERMAGEAESALAEATAAADAEAGRVLSAAREEATATVQKAGSDAEEIRAAAERERQLTVEGANTTRDRILEDLSRRRRIAAVQIEQLRAGRERLIESYAIVRRTLEEVQSELSRADTEARAAADDVGRRLQDEPEIELTSASAGESSAGEASAGERSGGEASVPEAGVGAAAAGESPGEAGEDLPGPTSAVDELFARIRGNRPEAEPAPGITYTAPTVTSIEAPAEAAGANGRGAVQVEDRPGEAPTAEIPVAAADAEEAAEMGAETGAEPAAEDALSALSGEAEDAEDAEDAVPDPDEALLQAREFAVVDLEVTLTRRLKRALQDEQNDVLDRLRNLRAAPSVAGLLPPDAQQLARYAAAARPLLAEAATAGAVFADETLRLPGRDSPVEVDVEDLATESGTAIVSALRRRLEQAIEIGSGDDQAVLVESLGAAYREWKTQRVERLAGDSLAAAFSRGTWQAAPDRAFFRWVVEDADGPCPDCDDDALAGELPKGEAFPTGQHYPPAHTGCRCLLVPSLPAD
jgi:DivIVA domain-containing protein